MIYNGYVMSGTLNLRAKAEAIKAARRARATRLVPMPDEGELQPELPQVTVVEEYVPANPPAAAPELGYYAEPSIYEEQYPPFRPFEHAPVARVIWYIVISPVWVPTKVLVAAGRRIRRGF